MMIHCLPKSIKVVLMIISLGGVCLSSRSCFAENWYENLESMTFSKPITSHQNMNQNIGGQAAMKTDVLKSIETRRDLQPQQPELRNPAIIHNANPQFATNRSRIGGSCNVLLVKSGGRYGNLMDRMIQLRKENPQMTNKQIAYLVLQNANQHKT